MSDLLNQVQCSEEWMDDEWYAVALDIDCETFLRLFIFDYEYFAEEMVVIRQIITNDTSMMA